MTSEVKKRKKGQILNSNERQLILNLIHYLKKKNAGRSISDVIREISKATGCSERTIYKIRKEGNISNSKKQRVRKKENKNSRNVKYDSFVKSSIRRKVHNYLLLNVPPTINSILCLVNSDPELPNFKRSTLHTLLKEIGFNYVQQGKKSLLTEKHELVLSRKQYLRDIRRFRNENRWILYTGETLVSLMNRKIDKHDNNLIFANIEPDKGIVLHPELDNMNYQTDICTPHEKHNELQLVNHHHESSISNLNSQTHFLTQDLGCNSGQDMNCGLGIDIPVTNTSTLMETSVSTIPDLTCDTDIPLHTYLINNTAEIKDQTLQTDDEIKTELLTDKISRELRFSIMHACCDDGFIEDVESIVLYKKKSEEINIYENWFLHKLLPKIPANSVIIVDNNAPYHQQKEANIPDSSWKKQQIKNWLLSNNIIKGNVNQKKEMLAIVNDVKPSFSTKHKIDEMAKERGIEILTLPPYHYELNPLNMIWSSIKSNILSNIKCFKIKKLKQIIRNSFFSISQNVWTDSVYHVRQMEDILWAVDEMNTSNDMAS